MTTRCRLRWAPYLVVAVIAAACTSSGGVTSEESNDIDSATPTVTVEATEVPPATDVTDDPPEPATGHRFEREVPVVACRHVALAVGQFNVLPHRVRPGLERIVDGLQMD